MSPRKFVSSGSPWEALAGYSRAVVDGRWVFVSGTVGYDLRTNTWPPTAETQAELSLDIIERALRAARAALVDVVRVRAYVPDRADVVAVSGVIKKRLGAARASNTTVCAPLAVENAKVEIEVTALKPPARRTGSRRNRAPVRRTTR
jgi:enamine deaminase RidA (YjgF/YER057c/UK114 family)